MGAGSLSWKVPVIRLKALEGLPRSHAQSCPRSPRFLQEENNRRAQFMVTEPLSGEMRGLCHWVLGCLALVSGHMLLSKVFGLLPFPQTELSLTQLVLKRPGCPNCPGPGLSHKLMEEHMLLNVCKEITSRAPSAEGGLQW